MIVDMPDTTTTAVNKKLDELRESVGAVTMGRVLTLIIAPDSERALEESHRRRPTTPATNTPAGSS